MRYLATILISTWLIGLTPQAAAQSEFARERIGGGLPGERPSAGPSASGPPNHAAIHQAILRAFADAGGAWLDANTVGFTFVSVFFTFDVDLGIDLKRFRVLNPDAEESYDVRVEFAIQFSIPDDEIEPAIRDWIERIWNTMAELDSIPLVHTFELTPDGWQSPTLRRDITARFGLVPQGSSAGPPPPPDPTPTPRSPRGSDSLDRIREENWQYQQQAAQAMRNYEKWVVNLYARRYGGQEAGQQARYGLSGAFGMRFTEVSREVFEAPKDAEGNLADPTQFGIGAELRDPHDAILEILMGEHPAPYVLEWVRDDEPGVASIAGAGHAWSGLMRTFGEKAVIEVARMIEQAPKISAAGERVIVEEPQSLGGWSVRPSRLLHELLVFGSGERFLRALTRHRADAKGDPDDPRSLPEAKANSEQLLAAADRVRLAKIEAAGPDGPGLLSDEDYLQFLALLKEEPGFHVIYEGLHGARNLVITDAGIIFGTTQSGGEFRGGSLFKLKPGTRELEFLKHFRPEHSVPPIPNSLALGKDGKLYGTVQKGGEHGAGLLYRIGQDGEDFTVLHHFNRDTRAPQIFSIDEDGALFIGAGAGAMSGPQLHSVFRLNADEELDLIYQSPIRSRSDLIGWNRPEPMGVLGRMVNGGDGFFYGVAGFLAKEDRQWQNGIFRLKKDGSEYIILHRFKGSAQSGTSTAATLIAASDGKLYGFTTGEGSANGVYRLDRDGSNYEVIFKAEMRVTSAGNLVEAEDGMLYFVLLQGGQPRLYRMAPDGGEVTIIDEFRDRSRRMSSDMLYHEGAVFSWTGNRLVRYVLPRGEPRSRVGPVAGDTASNAAPKPGREREIQSEIEKAQRQLAEIQAQRLEVERQIAESDRRIAETERQIAQTELERERIVAQLSTGGTALTRAAWAGDLAEAAGPDNPQIRVDTTLSEFLTWGEQEQRQAVADFLSRVVASLREDPNPDKVIRSRAEQEGEADLTNRLLANAIVVLFDTELLRSLADDPEAEPQGYDELITMRRYEDRLGEETVVSLVQHYTINRAYQLISGAKFPLHEREDGEQQHYIYHQLWSKEFARQLASLHARIKEEDKMLEEELRANWNDIRDNSLRLPDNQLVFIVNDEPHIVPTEPGGIQLATGDERERIWRHLRDASTTISDGRRIVIQDLPGGNAMVVVPPTAAGKFRMLDGPEAQRIAESVQYSDTTPAGEPVTECIEHFQIGYGREQALRMSAEDPERLLRWARYDYGGLEVWTGVTRLEAYLERRAPASAEIYLDLALAHLTFGRFDSAIGVLERGRREATDAKRFARLIETFLGHARSVKDALTKARDSLDAQGIEASYPDERIFAVALAAELPARTDHHFRILNIADAWVSAFPESVLALQKLADLNLAFAAEISGRTDLHRPRHEPTPGVDVPETRSDAAYGRARGALEKLYKLDESSSYPALRMMQHLLRINFTFRWGVQSDLPGVVSRALSGLDNNPNYTEKQKAFLRYGQAMFRLQQPTWAIPHMPKLIIESLEDAVRRDPDTEIYSSTLAWFRANADEINQRKRRAQAIADARSRQLAQEAFAPAGTRTPTGTTAGARLYYDLLQGLWDHIVDEVTHPLIGDLLKLCIACWGSGATFFAGETCPACEGSGGTASAHAEKHRSVANLLRAQGTDRNIRDSSDKTVLEPADVPGQEGGVELRRDADDLGPVAKPRAPSKRNEAVTLRHAKPIFRDGAGTPSIHRAEQSISYDGIRIDFRGGHRDIAELRAAAEAGDGRASLLLGELIGQGHVEGGAVEAVRWFERGHELGNAESTARLALHLLMGRGVDENDPRRAARNIRHLAQTAANGNSALGMYLFAECIAKGIGARADEAAARPFYQRAAAMGNPMAKSWCEQNGVSY